MPKIITMSWVDGSGKSTLSLMLHEKFSKEWKSVWLAHIGYNPFSSNQSVNTTKKVQKKINGIRYFLVLLKDTLQIYSAYLKNFWKDYLIYDRYVVDSLVKVQYKRWSALYFIDRLFTDIVLRADFWFLLLVDPETSCMRDADFPLEYHTAKYSLYTSILQKNKNLIKISAEPPVETICDALMNHVKRKKILVTSVFFPPQWGWWAIYNEQMIKQYLDLWYSVDFIWNTKEIYYSADDLSVGCRLYSPILPLSAPVFFSLCSYLKYILLWKKYDVVIGNHISLFFYLLVKSKKTKYINVCHNTYQQRLDVKKNKRVYRVLYPLLIRIEKFIMKKSDQTVCVSHRTYSSVQSYCLDEARVSVIENGVDVDTFSFKEKNNDEFNFLYIGRLYMWKWVLESLKIFHAFYSTYTGNKKISFFIVGDGALRGELQSLISSYGLEWVVFLEWYQKNTKYYYDTCHCCFLLSQSEGLSLVALETLVSWLKFIVNTWATGNSPLIIDHPNTLVVDIATQKEYLVKKLYSIVDEGLRENDTDTSVYWWARVSKEMEKLF